MNAVSIPIRVRVAIGLLYAALIVFTLDVAIVYTTGPHPSVFLPIFIFLPGLFCAAQLVSIVLVQRRYGWARFIYLAIALVTIPGSVECSLFPQHCPKFYHPRFAEISVDAAVVGLRLCGILLLFGGAAARWFATADRERVQTVVAPATGEQRRLRRTVILASSTLFALSLILPVFKFEQHSPVIGVTVLMWGWWGLLLGQTGWLANFPFLYALRTFSKGRAFASRVASIAALLTSLTSFYATEWSFNEGNPTKIVAHGAGFYVWLVSLLVLAVGSWLTPQHFSNVAEKPSGGAKLWRAGERAVRIVAGLSAIAFLPIVLLVGIMANDSGTQAGVLASQTVLGIGGALSLWVIVCSIAPETASQWFRRSLILRSLFVSLPVYTFALGGVSLGLMRIVSELRTRTMPTEYVQAADPSYPVLNSNPREALEIHGALPPTIPLASFTAVYKTDMEPTKLVSTACQRLYDVGPKETWHVSPLKKEDHVPVGAQDGQFRAVAYLDRYLSGRCNWHLSDVYYRLTFKDAPPLDYPFGPGSIALLDPREQAAEAAKGGKLEQGPAHVWCGKALNHAVTPYYPVRCGELIDFKPRISTALAARIPTEATQPRALLLPIAGTKIVELDFYDVDAPVVALRPFDASVASRSASEAARNARGIQCERDGVARLQWFFRSRPPEACRQAKVRELMHKCVIETGGTESDATRAQPLPAECTEAIMTGEPESEGSDLSTSVMPARTGRSSEPSSQVPPGAALSTGPPHQAVYRCTASDGTQSFSDRPCK
jgi:hypothetical protein